MTSWPPMPQRAPCTWKRDASCPRPSSRPGPPIPTDPPPSRRSPPKEPRHEPPIHPVRTPDGRPSPHADDPHPRRHRRGDVPLLLRAVDGAGRQGGHHRDRPGPHARGLPREPLLPDEQPAAAAVHGPDRADRGRRGGHADAHPRLELPRVARRRDLPRRAGVRPRGRAAAIGPPRRRLGR